VCVGVCVFCRTRKERERDAYKYGARRESRPGGVHLDREIQQPFKTKKRRPTRKDPSYMQQQRVFKRKPRDH